MYILTGYPSSPTNSPSGIRDTFPPFMLAFCTFLVAHLDQIDLA